jgi:hypothetical protein
VFPPPVCASRFWDNATQILNNNEIFFNLNFAPFSISGFGRRVATPKPASFAGAQNAPANDARFELT